MNRIDRYTIWLFIGYFIGALLIFLTLYIAVDAMNVVAKFKDAETSYIISYYLNGLPEIGLKLLPVACLLGVILTLTNLNKNNELVALFAAGMSLMRVAAPLLALVVIVSGVGYVMTDKLLPLTNKEKSYIYYYHLKKQPERFSTIKTDRIWYRTKDSIFNIKTLNAKGDIAQGLTMFYFSPDWDLLQMVSAASVNISQNQWVLRDGTVTIFTENSDFPLTNSFKTKNVPMMEQTQDLQSAGQTADMMTQKELKRFIQKNTAAGLDTVVYQVDYHSKISFAFAGLVMCLLGLPFSVGRARSGGTMVNVGICLGLIFVYYVFYSSGLTMGQQGAVSPVLAAWIPNIVMSIFALFLLKKAKR